LIWWDEGGRERGDKNGKKRTCPGKKLGNQGTPKAATKAMETHDREWSGKDKEIKSQQEGVLLGKGTTQLKPKKCSWGGERDKKKLKVVEEKKLTKA